MRLLLRSKDMALLSTSPPAFLLPNTAVLTYRNLEQQRRSSAHKHIDPLDVHTLHVKQRGREDKDDDGHYGAAHRNALPSPLVFPLGSRFGWLTCLGGPAFLDSLELPTLIDRHRDLLGRVFLFNGSLADRKGSDQVTTGKSTSSSNTKKNKRRQKKSAAMTSAVQRVFETCKEVFADGGPGIVPSPDEVERLRSVLDRFSEFELFRTLNLRHERTLDTLRWRVWLDRKEKILVVNARCSSETVV
ncbi:hypothetical protein B296_00003292 [Ensete ventricosum]|uniref:Uncharacterized protein n=1 Tax=Ensete ventricosum TaxID=4639 RepID=A0A427BAN2_ENSVE|nr:hypothetical protein B296_00003292 [Ensete ventricosum]